MYAISSKHGSAHHPRRRVAGADEGWADGVSYGTVIYSCRADWCLSVNSPDEEEEWFTLELDVEVQNSPKTVHVESVGNVGEFDAYTVADCADRLINEAIYELHCDELDLDSDDVLPLCDELGIR